MIIFNLFINNIVERTYLSWLISENGCVNIHLHNRNTQIYSESGYVDKVERVHHNKDMSN